MIILVGLAQWLKQNPVKKGKVSLLFQSAEETGTGAADVLKNWPQNNKPDMFFALHNLPNQTFGSVYCKSGTFSSASKGLIIRFTGKESHAAEPQNGVNPITAIAKLSELALKYRSLKGKGILTVIHAKVGSPAFGTSPGKGVLMLTLRTKTNEILTTLENTIKAVTEKICNDEGLKFSFSETEHFYHTYNSSKTVKMVQTVCEEQKIQYQKMDEPFAWSEDFGRFTHKFSGVLFALGAGIQEPLHSPNYDFNDDLIPIGIDVFASLIKKYLA
jgi:amidohydrolase